MQVVYAVSSAVVMTPDGGRHAVQLGQYWPADDPVVRTQPSLFTSDPRHAALSYSSLPADPPVETVTAAPGEKRAAVRRG